ncbi:UDP-2,4-diacetamido-2,4,6-trideoxy-beta-L-altropyranose hydrolase [Lysinibacillus piscis]|uniref:UDP-2,4-diacetamido-2,4, 6-trideoxy-beta-L-altropyranose hydrolase n=1 Tax=Lysinibacillus piscis TaxID=2518931 RepID=A0ABQ5NIC6_9BACI|nr:UDP-2,4-diacetamido-2,4,6-trideoxy-beta-L-altropyranose hydrolase [Lysinibacillus sp. KH24]GLC87799.1 UDP-2,4-diacetamido-2,4,6-trideoxy-beta-L-altropyranose hydrolase [Lysinibacillus sp. KH24]
MNIIIRTDASVAIGSGHVMRCLTIAKNLRNRGCQVLFWMDALEGNLIDFVANEGFVNITSTQQADLYIIDHYQLDKTWEQAIRPYTQKIVVIDDLAREHDCDLLVDQNVIAQFETRYDGKVPAHCMKLLGPKYLIMRDEFIQEREQLGHRNTKVERLLVFMGGSDPTNETMKILNALERCNFVHIDIVVGGSNPMKEQIEQICKMRNYHYHCQINYMAKLMQLADFAIGAGGSTLWERCYVGLPSSSTIVADNQRETTIYANALGVTVNLGWHEQVTTETYDQLLSDIKIDGMSNKGLELTANQQPNAWLYEIMELIK